MPASNIVDADDTVDVAIVGAGCAGAALALALLRQGVSRVSLIDRPEGRRPRVGESTAPPITGLLHKLGLDQSLERQGHRPYHGNVCAWGGSDLVSEDFLVRGEGHGWQLDRASFDAWLRNTALERGAKGEVSAVFRSVERIAGRRWKLTIADKDSPNGEARRIVAPIVVDASGRRASFLRRLGVSQRRVDHLVGLAVYAVPARPEALQGRTFIEAVKQGWWYVACLPNGQAIVTLMTDADIAREGRLHLPDAYRAAWHDTLHLKKMVPPPMGDFRVWPFSCASQYAEQVVGQGWLAIGDAMIGLDPLTGSGILGALEDAIAASEVIIRWRSGDAKTARDAAVDYSRRADQSLRRYLAERAHYYGTETRWDEYPFWQRRLDPITSLSGSE